MAERRWRAVRPEGAVEIVLTGAQAEVARRLARRLVEGATLRWESLSRLVPPGGDRVDVERTVAALAEGGLIEVGERRDAAGDFRPYQLRMAPGAEERLRRLAGDDPRAAEVRAVRARRLVETLAAMAGQPGVLPVPARTLVQRALGNTKAVRVSDYRDEIEEAFDLPLDALVRDHAAAVLTTGPFRIRFRDRFIDGMASLPWTALPEPVLRGIQALDCEADEVLTIENLTPFETLSCRGDTAGRILVFTSGFLGRAERGWMEVLVGSGRIRRVLHWGDIDPGGLAIYRDLADLVVRTSPAVQVGPWKMDAKRLSHPGAVPLTPRDRERLARWLEDAAAPLQDVARAMLHTDRKLEQEALLLDDERGTEAPEEDADGPPQTVPP